MSKTESAKPDTNVSFRTSIGGQALIEGILMRGPTRQAIVCRTEDGMVEKVEELHLVKEKHPILGWPLIRGVVVFLDSMVKGMKALTYSADLLPEDEQEEPGKIDLWIEKHFGEEKAKDIIIGTAVVLGIALSIVLFILIPTLLAGLTRGFIHSPVVRNLFEGLLRIVIFLLYLWGVAHMKDVERMFAYHGAEHKTIFCYEKGLPLTVENVRPQSRFHPRCGTSFLFVVVIISILVFSLVSLRVGLWDNPWVRIGLRLLLNMLAALVLGHYGSLQPYPMMQLARSAGLSGMVPVYCFLLITAAFFRLTGLAVAAARLGGMAGCRPKCSLWAGVALSLGGVALLHYTGWPDAAVYPILAVTGLLWLIFALLPPRGTGNKRDRRR